MQTDQQTKIVVDTNMHVKQPESGKEDMRTKLEKNSKGASRNKDKKLLINQRSQSQGNMNFAVKNGDQGEKAKELFEKFFKSFDETIQETNLEIGSKEGTNKEASQDGSIPWKFTGVSVDPTSP